MFVLCKECNERHESGEVETVDIAEDFQGRDVLTFICPETNTETESLVYCS